MEGGLVSRIRVFGARRLDPNGGVSPESWDSVGDMEALSPEDLVASREALMVGMAVGVASGIFEAQEDPVPLKDEAVRVNGFTWADVERFLHRVPPIEADFMRLRLDGLTQLQIATIFGVTQAAVSARLQKLAKRLQWLSTMPELVPADFKRDLGLVLTDREIEIMRSLYDTGSQGRTGEIFGITQGRVRDYFVRSLKSMRRAVEIGHPSSEAVRPYLTYFSDLTDNKHWALACENKVSSLFPHVQTAEIVDSESLNFRPGKSRIRHPSAPGPRTASSPGKPRSRAR